MKVILLQAVKNLGKKDDVVEVASGYAENFLFPKRLAVALTNKGIQIRDQQNQVAANIEAEKVALAQELAGRIGSITLEFKAKASTDGRMIGTISHKQIVDALKNIHHIEVDKRKFVDDFIVNAFGLTRLRIELHKGVLGQINVKVMEEKK